MFRRLDPSSVPSGLRRESSCGQGKEVSKRERMLRASMPEQTCRGRRLERGGRHVGRLTLKQRRHDSVVKSVGPAGVGHIPKAVVTPEIETERVVGEKARNGFGRYRDPPWDYQ